MKVSCSSTKGPEVGSAAAPVSVTKSSSPFGPAAKPSSATNCWTTTLRISVSLLPL
jgi:hypothetical protein